MDSNVGFEGVVRAGIEPATDEFSVPPSKNGKSSKDAENPISTSNFSQWLREWSSRFPKLEHPIDDSRESIYAGRGE